MEERAIAKTYMLYPDDVAAVTELAEAMYEGKQSMALRAMLRHYMVCPARDGGNGHLHYTTPMQVPESPESEAA